MKKVILIIIGIVLAMIGVLFTSVAPSNEIRGVGILSLSVGCIIIYSAISSNQNKGQ